MSDTRSRVRNSARNTFFGAAAFVLKLLLQFVVRALFIRYLSAEYLGLNGLFHNVLNILSLAELGIGNAIVYSMYKPVADGDIEKVKSLLALYKKLYAVIGTTITVLGLALIPALPYLITDAPNLDVDLTIVYVLYLAQTVAGYFFAYRRSLLFAYQRNDVGSKANLFAQVLLAAAQIAILVCFRNFYAYVAALVGASLLEAVIVLLCSFRLCPEVRGKAQPLEKEDRKAISRNTRALFLHKIGEAIVFSTDSIIISAFVSTRILGLYSNYTLVTGALSSIASLVCTSLGSSIGNYIATSTKERTLKLFHALSLLLHWLVGFLSIGIFCCFQDFIALFAGDPAACLDFATVALICVSFYFTSSRKIVNSFKDGAGLFRPDRFKPLAESALNLALDFVLVFAIGLPGVILATIVSTVLIPLWVEPFVLYKYYFKHRFRDHLLRYALCTLITAAVGGVTWSICAFLPTGSLPLFLAKFAICTVLPNLLFFLVYFKTPEFAYLAGSAKALLRRRPHAAATAGADGANSVNTADDNSADSASNMDGVSSVDSESNADENAARVPPDDPDLP